MQRTIPIPYYTSTLDLHVEEENLKAVLTAKMHGFHAEKSQEQLVLDALEHPVGSPRLRTLAEGKRKIVHRHQRPYPGRAQQDHPAHPAGGDPPGQSRTPISPS